MAIGTEWLTVAEACAYLKVTRATLYRWAREGRLTLYRLGHRSTRLRQSEVEALLHSEPGERVTVVGPSGSRTFALAPGLRTVKDAITKFRGDVEGKVVFVNQVRCEDLSLSLGPNDLVVVMPENAEGNAGPNGSEEQQGWLKLAELSFGKDWDNPQDAIYDNWKELYGLRDR
jgi:excisionase family DNA binding protein